MELEQPRDVGVRGPLARRDPGDGADAFGQLVGDRGQQGHELR
jgi:hypothetical protein